MPSSFAITIDDIRAAARRIADWTWRTPVVSSARLSGAYGAALAFKCENLQHVGAFKMRGAANATLSLDSRQKARGVVTHSSGNHGAALARAAKLAGIPAHVVMPHDSRPSKIANVRRFGCEPIFCEPDAASRAAVAEATRVETGAAFIHPYDQPEVMAGQGTTALELLEQAPQIDTVVIPVGGGGLLSGCLIAIKELRPEIQVYAAEPAWADDAARSLSTGRIEMPTRYDTVADGLRTPLGERTFPIIQSLLDGIILVTEESIDEASETFQSLAHMRVEPSALVALAAVATEPHRFRHRSTALVLTGGNLQ